MGDKNNSRINLLLQFLHQIKDLCLDGYVERCSRLIRNQKFRVRSKRHCNNHTLTHTTTEFMRILIKAAFWRRNTDKIEKLNPTFIRISLGDVLMFKQHFGNLSADFHHWVQRGHRILKNHTDLFTANFLHLLLCLTNQILSIKQNLSAFIFSWWCRN
ncbi:hypothetical protein D3C76_400320 [compost metagenome]